MALPASIFREYDIRGIAGKTLLPEYAYAIARAFAAQTAGAVCVARDGRISSPELMQAVCKGLMDSGLDVVDLGVAPTPMLYFGAVTLNAGGGIMITGSHNPPEHNGLKFVLAGKPFFGQQIQQLRTLAALGPFKNGQGKYCSKDLREAYVKTLLSAYQGTRSLSVVWDAGNGATGEIMAALCKQLPGRHIALNEKIDGTFPAHHPDPAEEKNLQQLIDVVRKESLDCGIAFDGDGDRIGVVDDEGHILWGDQLMMLYAGDVLRDFPGATIIADVKASDALFEEIARLGGTPLMWKTGHSLIKAKMLETGAKLAGEMSGHMFFADRYYGYDDGIYAAVRLLAILSRAGKKLSDLRNALPQRVNTAEMRLPCDDARKFAVIEEVKTRLKAQQAVFSDIDGVRVAAHGGWWLLRASNTQAVLVARCEAQNAAGLEALKGDLRRQLSLSNVALL